MFASTPPAVERCCVWNAFAPAVVPAVAPGAAAARAAVDDRRGGGAGERDAADGDRLARRRDDAGRGGRVAGALAVVDGALQPAGAVTVTSPFDIPPAAAVYVKVSVLPVEPLPAFAGSTVRVPVPFAALIVIDGEAARFVKTPAAVERSCPCQVCAPVVAVAVAPAPPPAFEPYVIVAVRAPGERQRGHGDRLRCDGDGARSGRGVAGRDSADRRRAPAGRNDERDRAAAQAARRRRVREGDRIPGLRRRDIRGPAVSVPDRRWHRR